MRIGPHRGMLGLAAPICFLLLSSFAPSLADRVVGRARPIAVSKVAEGPDGLRVAQITEFARTVCVSRHSFSDIAQALDAQGEAALGPLSAFDRYWLGSAWWAFHQPSRHIRYPSWAPKTAIHPDLALRHPEGGNCESSSSFQAALLSAMGVASRTVYGHYEPSGEGHVWVVSDVDGAPMFSDIHVARATEDERGGQSRWQPDAAHLQSVASGSALLAFLAKHRPDDARLSGLSTP